jgi:uncharacterized protein
MAQGPSVLQASDRATWRLDSLSPDRYDASMGTRTVLLSLLALSSVGLSLGLSTSVTLAANPRLIPISTPAGITIQAEIADTPQQRATGLMYREFLKKDHGMLFIFGQAQAWTFWMKNTKMALDLIWMDGKKRVVHIEKSVPICTKTDDSCPLYRPNSNETVFVLELTGGTVDHYKIEKGSQLQFTQ